ncbi:MAG: phage major capsid protein [Xanthobacteraceae bacterium]|nr:phage major capsid protein [Xanthobacteraceae bacterium]
MKEQTIVTKARVGISDAGEIEGVAWLFGLPDSVGDVIQPGAISFAKSVPMVREHDEGAVVGVWNGFTEDSDKLTVKGAMFVDGIAPARKARDEVKAGKATGLSLKFSSDDYEKNEHGGTTFKKAIVSEISLCRLPVHPGARITAVKSKGTKHMDDNNQVDVAEQIKTEAKAFVDPIIARMDKLEAKMNRPAGGDGAQEPTEQRKAFGEYLRKGDRASADVLKALVVSSDPQGGYLAPTEMSAEFIRDLVEYSPIRGLATVRSTSAPAVSYPKRIGATNAKWKGEGQAQEGSEPSFGQVEIPAREINTFVDISNQLLADSAGVAEAEVRMALAEDFGLKEGTSFLKGSGPLEPEGILNAAGVTVIPTGNASTLGTNPADLLIDVMYDLPAGYRGRGSWLMNGKTLAAARKWKDGTTGTYLWQPAYVAGQPETILGRPVIECPDMDDIGAGATPIVFGDIATGYRIVDRIGLSILVNPYLLATNGVTRIHATRRVGGAVVQAAALRKVVCKTA